MKHAAAHSKTFKTPFGKFTVYTGGLKEQRKKPDIGQIAWQFAYSVLWGNQIFSGKEAETAQDHIRSWINNADNSKKGFINLCQRVILARQHIRMMNADEMIFPGLWFNPGNSAGYACTSSLLKEVESIRGSLPNFKRTLQALAEAVLEFGECPSERYYKYWRGYFIDRNEPLYQEIFTTFCANFYFKVQ